MTIEALAPVPPLRPAVTPDALAAFAAQVRHAELTAPGVALGADIPLRLRINGNSTYLAVTAEIRRSLDLSGAQYDLTCRNDLNNGLVTWDLAIRSAYPQPLRKLLDWLVPVYTYED